MELLLHQNKMDNEMIEVYTDIGEAKQLLAAINVDNFRGEGYMSRLYGGMDITVSLEEVPHG